jgi:hypothetical protein
MGEFGLPPIPGPGCVSDVGCYVNQTAEIAFLNLFGAGTYLAGDELCYALEVDPPRPGSNLDGLFFFPDTGYMTYSGFGEGYGVNALL